ncbi:MAG: DoxX family protein [Myxococcales bacterium]|nr:DoxX family protein [Myxococcales bacterium]MCB9535542.1 DoxX family protein [Myxococcales bacterium]
MGAIRKLFDPGQHSAVASLGLLLLRLAAGGMMAYGHGWQKFEKYGDLIDRFPDPIGVGAHPSLLLAIGAELGAAILVALGFATRLAAVPLIVTMVVAAFVVHADDPFGKKEFALIYLAPFVALLFTGAGRFSVDAVLHRR